MVQINWTPQSISDLKAIKDYIATDSFKYAKLQVIKLRLRPRILREHIYAGKVIVELGKENYRELIEGNYRIIYKIVRTQELIFLPYIIQPEILIKENCENRNLLNQL